MESFKLSLVNLFSRASQVAATIVVSIFLARILGPVDFGVYRTVRSLPSLLIGLTSLLSPTTIIYFSRKEMDKNTVFWTMALMVAAVAFPIFVLLVSLSDTFSKIYGIPSVLFVLSFTELLFVSFFPLVSSYLKGLGNFVDSAKLFVMNNLLRTLVVFAAMMYGVFGAFVWRNVYWALSYLVVVIYLSGCIGTPRFSPSLAKKIFKYNAFLLISGTLMTFSLSFPVAFLGKVNPEQASFFSIAFFLASLVSTLSMSLMEVGIFRVAGIRGDIYESIRKVSKYSTYFSGFLAVSFLGFGQQIISLLLTNKYSGAVIPLYICTVATYLASAVSGAITYILREEKTHIHTLSTFLRALFLVVSSIYLIPRMGAIGASISFLISIIVAVIVFVYYTRSRGILTGKSYALRSFVAAVFSILIGKFVSFQLPTLQSLLFVPLISFSLYVGVIYLLKGFDDYDRELLKEIVRVLRSRIPI